MQFLTLPVSFMLLVILCFSLLFRFWPFESINKYESRVECRLTVAGKWLGMAKLPHILAQAATLCRFVCATLPDGGANSARLAVHPLNLHVMTPQRARKRDARPLAKL